MKRCAFLALFCLTMWGQQPEISQSLTLTTTGIGTPIFAGSGPANGAIAWRLIYSVDGTHFTAAQLAIQGANAPTAQACAALTAGDFTTITGSVPSTLVESSNSPASGAQGTVAVKAYYSCIVARVLSVSGTGGSVKTTLSGWRTSFAFPQTGSFGLADSRNVDSFGRLRTGASTPESIGARFADVPGVESFL